MIEGAPVNPLARLKEVHDRVFFSKLVEVMQKRKGLGYVEIISGGRKFYGIYCNELCFLALKHVIDQVLTVKTDKKP